MDGYFAVLLWYDYKKKRKASSLESLLAYNIQDVLSLEHLMITAYNQKIGDIPLKIKPLKPGSTPASPFVPDLPTINRIKKEYLIF